MFTPEANIISPETPSDLSESEDNLNKRDITSPLCAPVKLVNWSLSKLAVYQESHSFRHFLFIDPKAGRGRTVLLASQHDFRGIWGIEEHEHIAETAKVNIAQYPRTQMIQRQIEIISTQLEADQWPDLPLLLHIFTPPSETWLNNLLEGLSNSFLKTPRQIYLVMLNNPFKHLLNDHPNFELFPPPTTPLERLSLITPYNIEFYHSTISPPS